VKRSKRFKSKQYDGAKMTETKDILLVSFIVYILLYNYIGACISRKHGAKIPLWSGIIKNRDYAFYLTYIGYIALLLNGIISIFKESYTPLLALSGFAFMFLGTEILLPLFI